jgi:hypothetical protein
MKKLISTDYVIYDKDNDHVITFGDGQIVIFGIKEEADADCKGNERVIPCTDLPKNWQEKLLEQINQDTN